MKPEGKATASPIDNPHKAHFIYLVPSDCADSALVKTTKVAIENAALHLQCFFRWQLNGKTFWLNPNIVTICLTPHPAQWYSSNPNGGDFAGYFWNNVLQVGANLAGVGFYQFYNTYVVYVDAEPAQGQYAGGTSGGYTSGVCVMGAKDLASLRGEDPDWSQCRGIGGSGHEFGHTFGLPHPPGGSPDWPVALMGVGYGTYPKAKLTNSDKLTLDTNPFFTPRPKLAQPANLCPFNDSAFSRPPRPPGAIANPPPPVK